MNAQLITSCLKSHFFWAYTDLLLLLHLSADWLSAWAESCPCHDFTCTETMVLAELLADRNCSRRSDGKDSGTQNKQREIPRTRKVGGLSSQLSGSGPTWSVYGVENILGILILYY